jgi:FtsZ-binding cell division protein ZapB
MMQVHANEVMGKGSVFSKARLSELRDTHANTYWLHTCTPGMAELGLLTTCTAGGGELQHTPRGITPRGGTSAGHGFESSGARPPLSLDRKSPTNDDGDDWSEEKRQRDTGAAEEDECAVGRDPALESAKQSERSNSDGAMVTTPRCVGEGETDSRLVCPQCGGRYTAAGGDFMPKLLPCFHSLCAACVLNLQKYKGPGRRCPVCRHDVGYEQLPDNFVIMDLLADHDLISGSDHMCSNDCIGDDAQATRFCEQCAKFLCGFCVSAHSRQRATTGHTLLTMNELKTAAASSRRRRSSLRGHQSGENCKKHPDQKLEFFCKTCCLILCTKCALMEHPPPSHALQNVEEILSAAAIEVQELTERCTDVAGRLDASRSMVRRMCQAMQCDFDQAQREIESYQEEIIAFARAKASEALQAVEREKEEKLSEWEGKEDDLSCLFRRVADMRSFALAAIDTPSTTHLLAIKVQLSARLEECQLQEDVEGAELLSPHRIKVADMELAQLVRQVRGQMGQRNSSDCRELAWMEGEVDSKIGENTSVPWEELTLECRSLKIRCEDLKNDSLALISECKGLKAERDGLKKESTNLKSHCKTLQSDARLLETRIEDLKSELQVFDLREPY